MKILYGQNLCQIYSYSFFIIAYSIDFKQERSTTRDYLKLSSACGAFEIAHALYFAIFSRFEHLNSAYMKGMLKNEIGFQFSPNIKFNLLNLTYIPDCIVCSLPFSALD